MGQRLVINIKADDKLLANAYYHWSGYTDDAMFLVSKCLEGYEDYHNTHKESDSLLIALYMLSNTKAGFDVHTENERKFVKEKYSDFLTNISDRNQGLIAVTKSEMKKSLDVADIMVNIDIDYGTINFSGACDAYGDNPDGVKRDMHPMNNFEDIPVLDYDLNAIPFYEWDSFVEHFYTEDGFFIDRTDCYYQEIR